jgi:exonuclease III
MDMRFGTWNIRSLYRSGSFKTVARELGKYTLDLVGVQEVRWDKGGTERPEEIIHSSMERGMKIIS